MSEAVSHDARELPQADPGVTEPEITDAVIKEHGFTPEEYDRVKRALNRTPTMTELGIYSVMWSEHCSYKSSRVWLKQLPTTGEQVICGPGENAGIVDIGNGLAAVFKMESHNHPSFIEPYQGAATGVGGIMRDVFTMGARPVANLNALRFGAPENDKTRHLVEGVVAGIGGYGNCFGVPTVGGEVEFDPAYNGNILVNAMCVGLAEADNIFYAAASGIGNPVVYVGSKTGRDGIHGATMASAEFDDDSQEKRPTVQVGDPFTEKLLLEACLELMAEDAIVAIQDMGAAGLTSSSVEMAGKGNVGIELNLDEVPCREEAMTAYEMLLSESQERMLMVLKPGKEDVARRIFEKWQLDIAVIGTITDTGRMVVRHKGVMVADLPLDSLNDDAPLYERPYEFTKPPKPFDTSKAKAPDNCAETLLQMVGSPALSSRRWIYEQYDHTIMGDTLQRPGGDAGVVRVHGTNTALAVTVDVTPRYCYADPKEGGKQAVVETWRNLVATGAKPLAITDCMNFGNPERPEIMGQFAGCILGMKEACEALDYPVVSGNVSLYNETNGKGILPTPGIGGVGLIEDARIYARMDGMKDGDALILVGAEEGYLGQSLYLRDVLGMDIAKDGGAPPPIDLETERRNGEFVRGLIATGRLSAVHDISDGGLYVAMAELCMASKVGAEFSLPDGVPAHAALFGEDQSRYVIALPANLVQQALRAAERAGVEARRLGTVGGDQLITENCDPISVASLSEAHEGWFPAYMDATH
jgi:phosphoribosylformylglycinamidine synthase